jgi:hypothetical protein
MRQNGDTIGTALRIICAMLLVALAFAHRPASAAPVVDLAIYTLPDGSIGTLCLPGEDGKTGKHVDRGCEACRLASAFAMPVLSSEAENISLDEAAVIFAFAPERFHRLDFPPNAPPRGPPAFPVSSLLA